MATAAPGAPAAPQVSVVMPTHNRAHVIGRAIQSVLAQTMPAWELLILDDGSSDATRDAVRAVSHDDPRIHYVSFQVRDGRGPLGPSFLRDLGATRALGQWVTYLDDDNAYHPDYLRLLLETVASHEWAKWGVCFRNISITVRDAVGAVTDRFYRTTAMEGIAREDFLALRATVDTNVFFHRTGYIRQFGGWPDGPSSDLALGSTLVARAWHEMKLLPLVLVDYYEEIGAGGSSYWQDVSMSERGVRVLEDHLARYRDHLTPADIAALEASIAQRRYYATLPPGERGEDFARRIRAAHNAVIERERARPSLPLLEDLQA